MVAKSETSVYDFEATGIDGTPVQLETFRNQVLLVVNVASHCGYTRQYEGLEALYRKYRDRGFVVLGFPSDQFGNQEPGTDAEIQRFCTVTYGVTFPMFSKIDVNGHAAHALFRFLKAQRKGWLGSESIKWNFTKFLVGRKGQVLERFGSADTPSAIEPHIVRALADTHDTRGS